MNIKENLDVIIFFIIIKYKIYYFFDYLHRLAFFKKMIEKGVTLIIKSIWWKLKSKFNYL